MILLSILIPSTFDRQPMLDLLLAELNEQIKEGGAEDNVEILTCIDNRERTVGSKRNELYIKAKGLYSISIDSDDWIASNYIVKHLSAAKESCDAISLNGWIETNGKDRISWRISKDNPYTSINENGQQIYLRYNNHISAIKSEICKQFLFEDISHQEDYRWATAIHNSAIIQTEAKTEGELYFYRYNNTK